MICLETNGEMIDDSELETRVFIWLKARVQLITLDEYNRVIQNKLIAGTSRTIQSELNDWLEAIL